ncbi:Abi family protein [Bifidobacterium sp. ESL0732]|uniref:Abi family protein n=1 Tax=Bifidobacterium sp. ESL0732 TaxID=2983222 RepID=UPI0023F9C3DE|nr:Abi family protein [Bifidobacterium sp. ESL0732]WEV64373.1 Abi family protein [Bifidobacterium sp. ESL0732]
MSDFPGAINIYNTYMTSESQTTTLTKLQEWFSTERMSTYIAAADLRNCDPVDLYIWNNRVSKAFLEDIAHAEILLRNFISTRLAKDCNRNNWYDDNSHFHFDTRRSSGFSNSVNKIKDRLRNDRKPIDPGHVISGFTLGTWHFLLNSRLEQTVWKALRNPQNGGMPNYPSRNRAEFEGHMQTMLQLRNRLAHQEHIVLIDESQENTYLNEQSANIYWICKMLNPEAATWIIKQSRIAEVRNERP